MSDALLRSPLTNHLAQELREAVEARLEAGWKMPPFWSQVGCDLANMDAAQDERESYAFTDSLVLGYTLREAESRRSDARPVPDDIKVPLISAAADDRSHVALQTAVALAAARLPEVRLLRDEAWSDFDYWAGQFSRGRSRQRAHQVHRAAGLDGLPAVPAVVDYERALDLGYALRCCAEVSDFDECQPLPLTDGPMRLVEGEAGQVDGASWGARS